MKFRQRTLLIREQAQGRNTLALEVVSVDGTYTPAKGAVIALVADGVPIFGGTITGTQKRGVVDTAFGPAFATRVDAIDNKALSARRIATGVIAAGTTLRAAFDQFAPLLAPYGVTREPTMADGPTLPEIRWADYTRLETIFNDICAAIATEPYIWDVDYGLRLLAHAAGKTPSGAAWPAPINVTQVGERIPEVVGDVVPEPTDDDYWNRVLVRYAWRGSRAYAFMSTIAGGNFAADDEVTVGSTTYKLVDALANANDVLRGAGYAESLTHLAAAIAGGPGSGTDYHASTQPHSQVTASLYAPGAMVVKAQAVGTAGNAIGVSTTSAAMKWFGEGSMPLSTLMWGTDEGLSSYGVPVDDLPQQALRGIWETSIDATNVYDEAGATQAGQAFLARATDTSGRVTFQTLVAGFHPGQTLTITVPKRGLTGTWIVTDVEIRNSDANVVLRTVKCTSGASIGNSWGDVYKALAGGGGAASSSAVVLGGGGAVARPPIYHLGASPEVWVRSAAPTWVPANGPDGGIEYLIDAISRGSAGGTVRARLRAAAGSVAARLWDVDAGASVGESAPVTSTSFVTVSFPVTLFSGAHSYRLELLPGVANSDVNGIGYLE